jgi:hypothetical protein
MISETILGLIRNKSRLVAVRSEVKKDHQDLHKEEILPMTSPWKITYRLSVHHTREAPKMGVGKRGSWVSWVSYHTKNYRSIN